MKHYVYKVTFVGTPYYYYGSRTQKSPDEVYWGSPVSNRWAWELYEPEKQILEWFETREEANSVEDRIIRHFINDPNCLNEHHGGGFSLKSCSDSGKRAKEMGRGVHGASKEELSNWGVKGGSDSTSGFLSVKNGTGLFGLSPEEKGEAVKRGGNTTYELGVGCFAPENKGKGAKTTNSILWRDPDHPELGHLQAGPLACRQKKLGLPHGPNNRVRVKQAQTKQLACALD